MLLLVLAVLSLCSVASCSPFCTAGIPHTVAARRMPSSPRHRLVQEHGHGDPSGQPAFVEYDFESAHHLCKQTVADTVFLNAPFWSHIPQRTGVTLFLTPPIPVRRNSPMAWQRVTSDRTTGAPFDMLTPEACLSEYKGPCHVYCVTLHIQCADAWQAHSRAGWTLRRACTPLCCWETQMRCTMPLAGGSTSRRQCEFVLYEREAGSHVIADATMS